MKKKIFYWSPCLNPVGTVISTINSAKALSKYNKNFEVFIVNSCGEWDRYMKDFSENNVKLIDLTFNYFKFLPKTGYLGSRFSYIIIFLISFIPLLKLIKKEEPEFLIAHLITSLPLTLLNIFSFKTEIILRISGFPKLNFIRKYFWKNISKKLKMITCPTLELKSNLETKKIFPNNKLFYLPDAILEIKKIPILKKSDTIKKFPENKKIILAAGRLTKQKNFSYLIDEFKDFLIINDEYLLYIIGEGEEREKLEKKIKNNKLIDKVFLLGHKKNVYSYMQKSEVFVLSSLWEEVGFVIVEASVNNLYVIASDCPNGPKDFLNKGENGILFKSNVKGEILNSLIKYNQLTFEKKFFDKLKLKMNSKKFTKFNHYKKIKNLLI